jgi:hypothetical protein
MLEKIGGKREEAADRGLEGFVGWHGDEVEAEQFVCIGEIVRCQKNSCFTSRPASTSEFTWRREYQGHTVAQTSPSQLRDQARELQSSHQEQSLPALSYSKSYLLTTLPEGPPELLHISLVKSNTSGPQIL